MQVDTHLLGYKSAGYGVCSPGCGGVSRPAPYNKRPQMVLPYAAALHQALQRQRAERAEVGRERHRADVEEAHKGRAIRGAGLVRQRLRPRPILVITVARPRFCRQFGDNHLVDQGVPGLSVFPERLLQLLVEASANDLCGAACRAADASEGLRAPSRVHRRRWLHNLRALIMQDRLVQSRPRILQVLAQGGLPRSSSNRDGGRDSAAHRVANLEHCGGR